MTTQESTIVSQYLDGMTTHELGILYGKNKATINRLLTQLGTPMRKSGARRRYRVNEAYFDVVDSVEKAYWLGFLWADGHNNVKKQSVVLRLARKDQQVLVDFKRSIGSEHPIFERDGIKNGKKYPSSYVSVGSIHMCKALLGLGMKPDKTNYPLDLPPLSKALLPHFVRGYFDGDGSFSHADRPTAILQFTGNDHFLRSLQNEITLSTGIKGIYRAKSQLYGVLTFTGRHRIATMACWLFRGAKIISLQRKLAKYEIFCRAYYD